MKKMIIGITGASGSIYAKRLIEELLEREIYEMQREMLLSQKAP